MLFYNNKKSNLTDNAGSYLATEVFVLIHKLNHCRKSI